MAKSSKSAKKSTKKDRNIVVGSFDDVISASVSNIGAPRKDKQPVKKKGKK